MLRIERIRRSPLELRENVHFKDLIDVILMNIQYEPKVKQLDINVRTDLEGAPSITVDSILIRQAMKNLVDNAIKYTDVGGRIYINASYDRKKQTIDFFVQDSGVGIPDRDLIYIFEPFYRVRHQTNKAAGSGLGLSLVQNIIKRHNGRVYVRSRLYRGSRFGFVLPVDRAAGTSEADPVR